MGNKHLKRVQHHHSLESTNLTHNEIPSHTEKGTHTNKGNARTHPQLTKPSAHEDEEQLEHSYFAGGNANCNSPCGKQFGSFFIELSIYSLHESAMLLLGIFRRRRKTFVHTYTQKLYMNNYVGFIHNHESLIQPKCPSTEDG